jgi:hypothetical protein
VVSGDPQEMRRGRDLQAAACVAANVGELAESRDSCGAGREIGRDQKGGAEVKRVATIDYAVIDGAFWRVMRVAVHVIVMQEDDHIGSWCCGVGPVLENVPVQVVGAWQRAINDSKATEAVRAEADIESARKAVR